MKKNERYVPHITLVNIYLCYKHHQIKNCLEICPRFIRTEIEENEQKRRHKRGEVRNKEKCLQF